MTRNVNRRTFLKQSLVTGAGTGFLLSGGWLSHAIAGATAPEQMPKRSLGKTGFNVSLFSLGGLSVLSQEGRKEDALRIIHRALDLGVNFIDTAHRYGNGISEEYIGEVMRERRNEVFLATKSHDLTYDGTMRLVEESLRRLQTDYIDLYQHHFVNRSDQVEQLRQPGSARRAFEELKEQGVIGHIGITGHSSRVLADALEDYPYECALITLNVTRSEMDDPTHLDRFFSIATRDQVGVIAMKVMGRGAIVDQGFTARELLHYSLSYPVSTAIVGISLMDHLEENVKSAREFRQMSADEMMAMRRRAAI
ncbi:MAG: aldo/keto reductase [Balneolaceae bacterium]|nr:MAG: aldo/keto reductase [Balneolaceae bacterium]